MSHLSLHWNSDKGNNIQNGDDFKYRKPTATIILLLFISVVYVLEKHPDPVIHHGQYILASFSVYTKGQLFEEMVPLAIACYISEQFIKRWKVISFYIICAPVTVYMAETFGRFSLVEGMSGGTMGLVGFAFFCIVWYLVEDKESDQTLIAMIGAVVIIGTFLLSALYGYSVNHFNIFVINKWYSPSTSYFAHVSGSIIGMLWWLYEHYSVNTV